MIRANHRAWADLFLTAYTEIAFRRWFHGIYLLGDRPNIADETQVVLAPCHHSWWDGFFVHFLNRKILHRTIYLMMLEDQLRKRAFFSKVGVFSIRPGAPKQVLEAIAYMQELTEQVDRLLLVLFPQGRLVPDDSTPLVLARGLSRLRPNRKTVVVPLYVRTEQLWNQAPSAFAAFGEPILFDRYRKKPEELTESLEALRGFTTRRLAEERFGEPLLGPVLRRDESDPRVESLSG